MALKDLKSDLSKFRNPFKPKPIVGQVEKAKPQKFSTTPLSDRLTPDVTKLQAAKEKTGTDVTGKNPTGRHTKGTDVTAASSPTGRHTTGTDVTNNVPISGKLTQGTDVTNNVPLEGRHTTGKDVTNNVPISGKLTEGTDVANNVPLEGRHTKGTDVANNSAISGRHTTGKDVANNSQISGRHESDNSNFNIDGNPIGGNPAGRHDAGDTSNYNIDGQPIGGNPAGRHDGPDTSNYNIDGNPVPTNPGGRHDGPDTSGYNIDGTPIPTNPGGRHDSGDTSNFNIDGVPTPSQLGGRHDGPDTSGFNIDGQPTPTNPGGRHTTDNSNFNIDGQPQGNNPGGRHNNSPTNVNEVNYIPDIHATGFTSNFQPGTPTKYNIGSSQLQTPDNGNKTVNFITDEAGGAKGFTEKLQTTQFLGINGNTYTYPTTVKGGRMLNVSGRKLEAQLGEGTYVPNAGQYVEHPVKVFISGTGFYDKRRYDSLVGANKLSSLGLQYQQKNSPSFFDAMYNKFNLRDDAPQYGWINHPLILRGIQRKNNSDTQRWGFGIGGFDDGLIRAGAATAADRTLIDVARIGKWMASPRGLLWIVKNVGLGLTNPKVETNPLTPGPFGRQTRIHTGLTSLLSVAGGTFGLHFTRHGLPFVNEIASYEAVQITKTVAQDGLGDSALKFGIGQNRLVNLHYDDDSLTGGLFPGAPILSLSGPAGPQSVYGIGATTIRRYTNTWDAINDLARKVVLDDEFQGLLTYDITNQYAGGVSNSKYKTLSPLSTRKYTAKDIDLGGLYGFINNPDNPNSGIQQKYPIVEKPVNPESNPTAQPTNKDTAGVPITGIKAYSTLVYSKLRRKEERGESIIPNDFRNELDDSFNASGRSDIAGDAIGKRGELTYDQNAMEWKMGLGEQGAVDSPLRPIIRADYTATSVRKDGSVNTSNFYEDKVAPFRGDKINMIDAKIGSAVGKGKIPFNQIYSLIKGQAEDATSPRDFVRFYFTGPTLTGRSAHGGSEADGASTEEVLVFRSTISNFSDQFSPSWNSTQILGRADAVHTYNTFARSVNFDFKVFATSRDEMRPLWRKLNYLASWSTPNYKSGLMRGGYIRLTLGNLFQETPCFINSLTVTVDGETPWEINLEEDPTMLQLPHGATVSLGLTMIMDYRPQWNGRMWSLSDRGRKSNTAEVGSNWLWDSSEESATAVKAAYEELAKLDQNTATTVTGDETAIQSSQTTNETTTGQ